MVRKISVFWGTFGSTWLGVSEGVSGGVSPGPFKTQAPECPQSPECPGVDQDTLEGFDITQSGAWILNSPGTPPPPKHSLGHPDFRGHSVRHHFGSEGHKTLVGGRGSFNSSRVWKAENLQKGTATPGLCCSQLLYRSIYVSIHPFMHLSS